MADGILNPHEMDVTVNWRRPSVCELTDPVRSPIAYLVERTDADAPDTGPYRLVTRRTFDPGGEPEVVPAVIADQEDGSPRFADGYFADRGPGYGTFHYRVLGRDLFGRTSAPSGPAAVARDRPGGAGATAEPRRRLRRPGRSCARGQRDAGLGESRHPGGQPAHARRWRCAGCGRRPPAACSSPTSTNSASTLGRAR